MAADADRLVARVGEDGAVGRNGLAVDLVGPAGVVAQTLDGQFQVGGVREGVRLAVVERLQRGQVDAVALHQVGQPVQQPAALRSVRRPPRRAQLEGAPRRRHRQIHVGLSQTRNKKDEIFEQQHFISTTF